MESSEVSWNSSLIEPPLSAFLLLDVTPSSPRAQIRSTSSRGARLIIWPYDLSLSIRTIPRGKQLKKRFRSRTLRGNNKAVVAQALQRRAKSP